MSYLESKNSQFPDHKKPSKLDKIKAFLEDPESYPLDSRLKTSLDNYKLTLSFLLKQEEDCHGFFGGKIKRNISNSPNEAINYLETVHDYSYPQAAKIVRETLQLYGNIFKYDKESLRFFHYERLLSLSREAQASGDYKAARAIEKEAIELMDLKNFENVDKKQILQFFQININRTTDPAALKNTIDITPPEGEDE